MIDIALETLEKLGGVIKTLTMIWKYFSFIRIKSIQVFEIFYLSFKKPKLVKYISLIFHFNNTD